MRMTTRTIADATAEPMARSDVSVCLVKIGEVW
jgi:hypothetical protein